MGREIPQSKLDERTDRAITDPDEKLLLNLDVALAEVEDKIAAGDRSLELPVLAKVLMVKRAIVTRILQSDDLYEKRSLQQELIAYDTETVSALNFMEDVISPEIFHSITQDLARRMPRPRT